MKEVNRLLNQLMTAMGDTHWEPPLIWPTHWKHHPLPIKWRDESNEDEFRISCELPGFKKEDVLVNICEGRLEITAEREGPEDYSEYRLMSINLDKGLDTNLTTARMELGLITIKIPRKNKSLQEKRTILIE